VYLYQNIADSQTGMSNLGFMKASTGLFNQPSLVHHYVLGLERDRPTVFVDWIRRT
jgi:hypothetical protein